jgi:ABC-2 type transport system ATP-binding protein
MEKQVNNLIETYSHGMVKKIQLITAFLIQPELIVIDETLNGIDIEAKEISKLLMNQLVGKDKTVLMCTHDLEFAREIGSRIIIMHKGTIYQDSSKNGLDSNSTLTDIVKSILKFKDNAYEI